MAGWKEWGGEKRFERSVAPTLAANAKRVCCLWLLANKCRGMLAWPIAYPAQSRGSLRSGLLSLRPQFCSSSAGLLPMPKPADGWTLGAGFLWAG